MKKETHEHPSYGVISFSRTYGGEKNLFGSSIKHQNTIRMKVSHAKLERRLNEDHVYEKDKIIEVEMSEAQFAQAITSLNSAAGVPVTLLYTQKEGKIPPCNFSNKRETFVSQ